MPELSGRDQLSMPQLQGRDHLRKLDHHPPAVREISAHGAEHFLHLPRQADQRLKFHISSRSKEGMICARSRSMFPDRMIDSPWSILAARSCLEMGGTGPSSGM